MSTDDERRADEARTDGDTPGSDEHRDPTAPPPLPVEPTADRTQPIGTETQAFTVPSPPPAPSPQYDEPSYTRPSYSLPSYGSPDAQDTTPAAPPSPADPTPTTSGDTQPPHGSTVAPHGSTAAPYGSAPSPYPQDAGAGSPPPPANPYAASNPYATPAPPPGGYPYAAPPTPYQSTPSNTSAIVLTVLSGLALVSCCNVVAIGSLVLGIMGISRNTNDPADARRLTRIGWWVFGVSMALVVIGIIAFFALGISGAFDGGSGGSFDSDGSFDGY